jgi:hypothetical protein
MFEPSRQIEQVNRQHVLQLLDVLLLSFFLLGISVANGNRLLGGFET